MKTKVCSEARYAAIQAHLKKYGLSPEQQSEAMKVLKKITK